MFRGNVFTHKRSTEKCIDIFILISRLASQVNFVNIMKLYFLWQTNKHDIKQCPNLQKSRLFWWKSLLTMFYQYFTISFKRQLIFINNISIIPGILNLLDICDHLPYLKANKTIGNIICKNSSCWSFDVVLLCCAREKMFWQVFGNLGSQCVRSKYQILETSILREEI